jgi:hypothetical protein
VELAAEREVVELERAAAERGRIPLPELGRIEAEIPALGEIAALTGCFNPVELITIDRVEEVREEFLAARPKSNPTFTYQESTAALDASLSRRGLTMGEVERRLLHIEEELRGEPRDELEGLIREALLEKIEDDLATIELYRGLIEKDDLRVKRAFASKYGSGVDEALFAAAEEELDRRTKEPARAHASGRSMSAGQLADAMRWMLDRYYAHYQRRTGRPIPDEVKLRVVVDPRYSSVDVRDKSSEGPVIGIPPVERTLPQCLALLRHEIDQHARQSLNGRLMFGFGGGLLKTDEETWYEGLAKQREMQFMRERFGARTHSAQPWFVFAIRMADEGKSFVEVFEAIREMSGASTAWITTYRVFRGHHDTSNRARFGLAKDRAYLAGWMLQEQLDARGLSHLNEAAVCRRGGLQRIARFDFGPEDLLFPDLDLTSRWFEEVMG